MSCELIQGRMRPYLEDLLSESEYQAVRAHLSECAACRAYASSIGTLIYQLEELGEVKLPQDLVSTIFYQVHQGPAQPLPDIGETPGTASKGPRAVIWIGIVAACLAVAFFYWKFGPRSRGAMNAAVPMGVSQATSPETGSATGPERDRLGKLFEKMKTTFYGSEKSEDAIVEKLKALVEDAEADPSVSVMKELKIILRSEKEAEASGILAEIERMASASPEAAPMDSASLLKEIKAVLYGADEKKLAELRSVLRQAGGGPQSLEEWRPVHWHYHLSSSSQSEFLQVVQSLGLTVDYESSNFFILYVPKSGLNDFIQKMGAISGVVTNFNEMEPARVAEKSVQVSVYLLDH